MLTIWFQYTLLRKANTKLYYDIRKWQYNATLKINEKWKSICTCTEYSLRPHRWKFTRLTLTKKHAHFSMGMPLINLNKIKSVCTCTEYSLRPHRCIQVEVSRRFSQKDYETKLTTKIDLGKTHAFRNGYALYKMLWRKSICTCTEYSLRPHRCIYLYASETAAHTAYFSSH